MGEEWRVSLWGGVEQLWGRSGGCYCGEEWSHCGGGVEPLWGRSGVIVGEEWRVLL